MPNRILKESICTSYEIDQLGHEAEVLFYRLLVNCDDYGRMDARPPIVRSKCFPLQLDHITDKDVKGWLDCLVSAGILTLYEAEGKPYLYFRTWDRHQQKRAKHSKYPDPVQSSDINGNHLQSNVPENREYENTRNENTEIICNQRKPKKPYGQFQNVLLTDEEHQKLRATWGPHTDDLIEDLSIGIQSKGYKYKSHYAAILNWQRREKRAEAKRNPRHIPTAEERTPTPDYPD